MIAHMREMAAALQPRGVYAVGLSTTIYGAEMPSEDVWEGRRRGVRVKQIVQYEPPVRGRFEKVYSHLVVRRAGMEEHRDSAYRLRCYSREQWLRLIGRSGMDLLDTVDEDGESIAAPELGYALWILRAQE